MMELPAILGFVFRCAFNQHFRVAGIFPGVAFISHGGTESRRIVFHLRLLANGFLFFSLRAFVPPCDQIAAPTLGVTGAAFWHPVNAIIGRLFVVRRTY